MRTLAHAIPLALYGCGLTPLADPTGFDFESGQAGTDTQDSGLEANSGSGSEGQGGGGGGGGQGGGSGGQGAGSGGSGEDDDSPRAPVPGDLVISEIMVNPSAVEDAKGEWLELLNISSDSLDLTGLYLSDDDVDGTAITGAVVIESGQYVVLCAHRPTGDNGGVVCDTSYPYVTTGGGFSLTNTHDEVKVSADDGTLLDEVSYPEGSMPIGKSIGVDSDNLTPSRNDDINRWCIQTETMSGGDQGTPGSLNSSC